MDAENGKYVGLARLFAVLLCAGIFLAASQSALAKVYRWVDENGDVHYSESLPADLEDRKHDIINNRGDVIRKNVTTVPPPPKKKVKKTNPNELPRDKSGMKRPAPLYPPAETQRRLDAMMLLRYESEKDLVDAMNVEINQLAYDKRLIQTTLTSVWKSYKANVQEAGDRQRVGLAVSGDLVKKMNGLRARVNSSQQSLNVLKQRESSIRDEYDVEIARYRKLVKEAEEQS